MSNRRFESPWSITGKRGQWFLHHWVSPDDKVGPFKTRAEAVRQKNEYDAELANDWAGKGSQHYA